jgi:hypothetical protein
MSSPAVSSRPGWRVWLVTAYLLAVFCWLRLRGRLPSTGLRWWIMSALRQPLLLDLTEFRPETGFCYCAPTARMLPSDRDSVSPFVLLEDGVPLPHPHCPHDEIRRLGRGRYSHWGGLVYLAASDNSDPRSNGRSYRLQEVRS